jgi:hypothetical protein
MRLSSDSETSSDGLTESRDRISDAVLLGLLRPPVKDAISFWGIVAQAVSILLSVCTLIGIVTFGVWLNGEARVRDARHAAEIEKRDIQHAAALAIQEASHIEALKAMHREIERVEGQVVVVKDGALAAAENRISRLEARVGLNN